MLNIFKIIKKHKIHVSTAHSRPLTSYTPNGPLSAAKISQDWLEWKFRRDAKYLSTSARDDIFFSLFSQPLPTISSSPVKANTHHVCDSRWESAGSRLTDVSKMSTREKVGHTKRFDSSRNILICRRSILHASTALLRENAWKLMLARAVQVFL